MFLEFLFFPFRSPEKKWLASRGIAFSVDSFNL